MKTKVTQKTKGLLLVLLFAVASFGSFAQTNKEEKTKQDEQGAALKKWFDSGDIIIEGTVEDWKGSSFKNADGKIEAGLCQKVKINRILKGNLNIGYINIKTKGQNTCGNCEEMPVEKRLDPDYHAGSIFYSPKTAFLIKIKKSDIQTGGCFTVENGGIYIETGLAKTLYNMNPNARPFDNSVSIYQMLQKYCNVKVDLVEVQKGYDKRQAVQDSIEVAGLIKNTKLTEEQKKKIEADKARILELRKHAQAKRDSTNSINNLKKKINNSSVSSASGCSELFISEQLDGQGSNNAVEIYNPTNAPINLSNYKLLIYHNASLTPTTIALTGTISAFGTHVVVQQGAISALTSHANQTTNNLNFNGNVVTALNKGNAHIDIIGEIGVTNTAGNWTLTPTGGTNNNDIRRKYTISAGDTNWTNCKSEWSVFSEDSISNFGHHTNVCSVDPDLNVSFANPQVVGGNFEFDVMVSSTGSSTYLDVMYVDLSYNPSTFGTHVVANNNVTITLGTNFNTSTYTNPMSAMGDEGVDSFYVFFAPSGSATSWNRHLVTSTPEQLYHISMAIANCNHAANIQFTYQGLDAESDNYAGGANDDPNTTPTIPYDTAFYNGTLTTFIPPCSTNPQITSFTGGLSPNSVAAGAADQNTGGSESLLTINGSGFGFLKPTVYMKNAVSNSNPQFIPLDNYDIQTYNDNQITLLVPSTMYPIGTSITNLNYTGTGNIYVKANGATDSAVSSSMVQVPYSLLNKRFGSSHKDRVPFAYRRFFSSTSFITDTTAYDFRFDLATVTNNVQPMGGYNCRALLKRTIEDWACKIPIKYRIGRDTTITTNDTIADGISYITFKSSLSNASFGAETSIKVNGACATGHIYATEADVSFNSTVNWNYVNPTSVPNNTPNPNMYGTPYADFFTTALHEFGHASLLLHVNQTSDLMYFAIPSTTGVGPYISTDDAAGASDNLTWSKSVTLGTCPYNPFTIPASGAVTCIDPETGTGIDEIGNNNFQVSIYPNPAADFINVTFTKQSESSNTIKLVNVIGQTVFYSNIGKNEGAQEVINLQSISKGVYLLIITDNSSTITKKIIVE